MEEIKESKANDVLRSHHSVLTNLIVSAGLRHFADECEAKGLITPGLKERVVSISIGKTESDRASLLVDEIRRSLGIDAHGTMDEFLCVLFTAGYHNGQSKAKQLAKEYGFSLTKLNKVVETHRKSSSSGSRCSVGVASRYSTPTVRDLAISLKDLVKWEEFAQHLPHISQADITRIKIENNFDVEAQKRALFDKWLRVDTEANWEKVVEVLDLNGESKLSKNIRTKYNITDQVTSVEPAVVTITSEATKTSRSNSSNSNEDQPDSGPEIPDSTLDQKKLYQKVPIIQDILTVVPEDCYNEKLRAELKLPPAKKTLEEGMKAWIDEETSEVTWLNLIQAVKKSGYGAAAKHIAGTFLRRPSVYKRYISTSDYESFDDLGI